MGAGISPGVSHGNPLLVVELAPQAYNFHESVFKMEIPVRSHSRAGLLGRGKSGNRLVFAPGCGCDAGFTPDAIRHSSGGSASSWPMSRWIWPFATGTTSQFSICGPIRSRLRMRRTGKVDRSCPGERQAAKSATDYAASRSPGHGGQPKGFRELPVWRVCLFRQGD